MIKAKHTFLGDLFFKYYSQITLNRHFRKIHFEGTWEDKGLPVLIVSNHFSWWDGFIQLLLSHKVLNRRFHVMMLEDQLNRFMILNSAGCFSVRKNSRDAVESLKYSIELLEDKSNMLLIFPQGEVQSMHHAYCEFETGIQYLLRNKKTEIQLLFNVNLIDYFSQKKADLSVYFKEYEMQGVDLKQLEIDFNDFLMECKQKQSER